MLFSSNHLSAIIAIMMFSCLFTSVKADTLTLTDGRVIKGEILKETSSEVTIDAKLNDIRATMTIARTDIESVSKAKVAPDFFKPKPVAPDKRLSDPKGFSSNDTLYLTIPVKGKIGVDFEAKSLERILSYAKRYRINHLVFEIDSDKGGNLDEASDITKLLVKNQASFTYHALITNCLGNALGVAIPCDHLILLPGAKIGGVKVPLRADKHPDSKIEYELLLRQQLAIEVEDYLIKRGRLGMIARAMVDPYDSLVIWRDKDVDILQFSSHIPKNESPAEVILKSVPGEPLVLTAEQAYQLGAPKFKGDIAAYGKDYLQIKGWKKESEYAEKIVQLYADKAYARQAAANMLFQYSVERNIERRAEAIKNLEHHLTNAIKWDPEVGSLARKNASWGWRQMPPSLREEAIKKNNPPMSAKLNTVALSQHMLHAIRAIRVMKDLDQEASKLGLKPSFQPGDLEKLFKDIMARHEKLKALRKKAARE